ncbi:GNAT family N-acetyltransferase [Actinacidiphila bryophytorum]|jgi:ribosomal-protein-alanine N-acetyltransferase|uniref:GNAT family N-acetyltransferase n=1 Tax=Actinacidiphila bryophytorum TaxID=1436133 RepID=UPI0021769BA9|nr:GNAT family protein [Actinacidiphila bryophytorum]UWE10434.1 GNAT family N-acetyltransferase [Actinacidiphila bryophytorum]
MPGSTRIRLLEPADAAPIAAHRARDAEALRRWEPERPAGFLTAEGQAERIDMLLARHRAGSSWPGVVLAGDQVIGQVTVLDIRPEPHMRRGTVGYWIAGTAQNRGHAGRALGLVLQVMTGELGLRRAEAATRLENLASHQVLRRNGFSPYGIAHASIFIDGSWRDDMLWERNLGDQA